jgi:hypothetical protein
VARACWLFAWAHNELEDFLPRLGYIPLRCGSILSIAKRSVCPYDCGDCCLEQRLIHPTGGGAGEGLGDGAEGFIFRDQRRHIIGKQVDLAILIDNAVEHLSC